MDRWESLPLGRIGAISPKCRFGQVTRHSENGYLPGSSDRIKNDKNACVCQRRLRVIFGHPEVIPSLATRSAPRLGSSLFTRLASDRPAVISAPPPDSDLSRHGSPADAGEHVLPRDVADGPVQADVDTVTLFLL